MQINFQAGVEDIYDACVAKGSTPASTSLSDVVAGIMAIPTGITPSGTISITSNGTKDVSQYASANVAVPNSNSGTYNFPANDTGGTKDLGVTNTYRYVNASNVYNKGVANGRSFSSQTKTFTVPAKKGRWETLTAATTFGTKIVGFTGYNNNSQPWNCVMSIGISGKNISCCVDACEHDYSWNFTVTAIGY